MKNVFISLFPEQPDGFEFRTPTKRDLRACRVAIFCNSVNDAFSLMENYSKLVYGLVITKGETFSHSNIGPELWHLIIPPSSITNLHKIVSFLFDIMANSQTALDQNSNLKIELSLCQKIQKQTQISYNQSFERLRNKASEIRHLIDNSQFGIFRTNVEGKLFFANTALTTILGYSSLHAINKVGLPNLYQFKSDRDHLLTLAQSGPVKEFETPFIKADGTIIDLLLTIYPVFGENGKLQFLEGNLLDITEKNLAAKEISYMRNYLSGIVDSMPSVLLGVNKKGKVTLWNKTAEQTTGISATVAKGKPLVEVFPKMSTEIHEILSSMENGEIIHKKKKPYKSGNLMGYEDVTIFPLIGQDLDGAVIKIDDVSKQCEMEKQLNHSHKMEAIGQLAGGVAHDFNNLLGAILGASELLKSSEKCLNEENIQLIDMIIKASTRAADLTAKLLAFGRKGNFITSIIDIHDIIDDTVSLLNSTIDKKITITVTKNATVHMINGNTSGIHSTLINLGINASHAMPDGGELLISTKNVYLDSTYCNKSQFIIKEGKYIEIEVRDTGCGIPNENLFKIFEPFFTTKEQGTGTGLGLAAVYGIVQDHKGGINVISQLDIGTSFQILLPCPFKNSTIRHIEPNTIAGSGLVLLVDDEELFRIVGELMLKEMGYSVILAENGKVAVNIFKEKYTDIDIVVMDMIMPEMNGLDAYMEMHKIDSKCKVILSSGFSKSKDIEVLIKKGLAGFIQKPYKSSKLSQLLSQVLSK